MLNSSATDLQVTTTSWQNCLNRISEKVGPSNFETWFRTIDCTFSDSGAICLQVPNQFFADFIEQNFLPVIKETFIEFHYPVDAISFIPIKKDWKIIEPLTQTFLKKHSESVVTTSLSQKHGLFHPNYSFLTYIVGDSNRMAHAACLAVAEAPGKTSFNPLIIYGGTGLGKTHLLQSIGHFAQTEHTADNIMYLTSEEFTNQYINYVVHKKDSTSFYKTFLKVDLLLIDDIQFFGGKPGTQKEFFRIFNKLLLESKQIVLTSDRPPEKIPDMMEHIINRFLGGLITDIQPPNLETRMAILQKKAENDGMSLPSEVVQYIAGQITSNVRELEGILIKLFASASFTGKDITLEVAREICGDVAQRKDERLSIRGIQEKVASVFDISANQLSAHTRKRDVSIPRNVAMYLAKKWTKQSLRTIGLEFGGRDYSTVIHACKKIEGDLLSDQILQKKVAAIEDLLKV